ncbi:hypothetical protein JHK87_018202 [Glycine soja]|nr:hypothetical protein JHK87_018202 [Glycine soja]
MVLVRSGKCFLHLIVCVLFKIRHRFCLYCETDDVVVSSERELSDGEFSAKNKNLTENLKGKLCLVLAKTNKEREREKGCLVRVSTLERNEKWK